MKFAICNEVFEGWAIDDSIKFVAETGYDAIEIAPFTLAQYVTEVSVVERHRICLLYTSPSPRDGLLSRMPSSA